MKTLQQQLANKCKHFNGIMSKTCRCGINYQEISDPVARPIKLPCFKDTGMTNCDKAEFRTSEDVAAEVKEMDEFCSKGLKAMLAVKLHISETRKLSGVIVCPSCKGDLKYSSALSNGHTRGFCECGISWME
jgi:hypothetical protein